jgi:dTDP-4-amino-4,6-dideoxygalactose transaminase
MTTASSVTPMPFIDLAAQRARLSGRIEEAIARVLEHGRFIMGPEVTELEARLAALCGVAEVVSCASGTDALLMSLLALRIGPGDAVLVPSFTFAATAEVVALLGATPVFVDSRRDTCNLDPASLPGALHAARHSGNTPRALIAVDVFGQPAAYDEIEEFCAEYGLALIADAAQSFGATWQDRRVGAIGDVACTSFFPSKPLGCYGDGGAIFTEDPELASVLRSLRVHGQGEDKYDNVRVGINGRLDTVQAAVLLQKLEIFADELTARERVAARYSDALGGVVGLPTVRPEATSVWAQYTVSLDDRDAVAARLRDVGIPTAVHYPKPLHRQPAYAEYPTTSDGLPAAEELSRRVLSLPMHPYLDEAAQDRVVAAVRDAVQPTGAR